MNKLIKINKMKKMNKKADIPITILVIGVFAVCGLAILSFMYSEKLVFNSERDLGINLFEEIYIDLEMFYFYINKGDVQENVVLKIKDMEFGEDNKLIIKKTNGAVSILYEVP